MRHNVRDFKDSAPDFRAVTLDGERAISFGPFRLLPTQRLLLEAGKPVRLGSRALDILIALVERPGDLISKKELMARVWPNTFVEPANLTVHVAALRRALSDGQGSNRYLINITGRGYRFVAPVTLGQDPMAVATAAARATRKHNLPLFLSPLIGRADAIATLAAQLSSNRLITIVGPGGIGKTSIALALAKEMIPHNEHGTWLIDLAPLSDPRLLPRALASALGLEIPCENALAALIAILREKQMLLAIDNCEHVIAAAAALAAGVLRGAPGVRILATSREPLRSEGEQVHCLAPLASPAATTSLSAAEILNFPAVQLFVERAAAAMNDFKLLDADAAVVADICRKLDGIPLAIELAATRVDAYGLQGLADRLDDRIALLTNGRRTRTPRHHTMSAALDWSYRLLSKSEQTVLRRLSIFSDDFTLRSAGAVASDDACLSTHVIDEVTELVAKSLVGAEARDAEPRLRLLGTTRAYALAKLAESGEFDAVARRHAVYSAAAANDKAA
jgi:predicted ATPase/DNA-binding winged helix-turn-helix (wHTH) protein